MKRGRTTRVILSIYPRAWRERYANEIHDLAEELVRTDNTSFRQLNVGLLYSGLGERARSWGLGRLIITGVACVMLVAIAMVSFSSTAPHPTRTAFRGHSKDVVIPNVIVLNPATGAVVTQVKCTSSGRGRAIDNICNSYGPPQHVSSRAATASDCIVNLNPTTGAVIYAKSVRNRGASCSALILGNHSDIAPKN